MWTLSYSLEGKKRVETLPADLAAELLPLVEQGREVREGVMEVLAINIQLLRLWREQQRSPGKQAKRQRAMKRRAAR